MPYRDNVTALAEQLGISNNPSLKEEDLTITALRFFRNGHPIHTDGSPMNKGARLFFQGLNLRRSGDQPTRLCYGNDLLEDAAEYFAENWEPYPEFGKRKLLDAFRASSEVLIFWKETEESGRE